MALENTRSMESRETEMREYEDYTFEEPDALAIPEEVKDRFANEGVSLRWIRTSIKGKDDISNVGKRLQDGWVFVAPDEVPEMAYNSFVKEDGRYAGTVCRGDLSLAKCPTGKVLARQRYYEDQSRKSMEHIDAQLGKLNDSRAPVRNSSKSEVMTGRMPTFQK